MIVTGSSDCTVKLWSIPEDVKSGHIDNCLTTLEGHSKRILFTTFHPAASNVLAVADFDKSMMIWDLEKNDEPINRFDFDKPITDLKWRFDGSALGVLTRDQRMQVMDPRSSDKANGVLFEDCHQGAKAMKMAFIDSFERIFTFGVGRTNAREFKVWDIRNPSKALDKTTYDRGSGTLIPFYERSTNLLFVAGKGDSSMKILEAFEADPFAAIHSQVSFGESAVGYCVLPRRSLDTKKCEVARILRLTTTSIQPLSLRIPRRATNFQKDLYKDDVAGIPSMTASQYFSGESKPPVLTSLDPAKQNGAGGESNGSGKSRADVERELAVAKRKLRILKAEVSLYKSQLK